MPNFNPLWYWMNERQCIRIKRYSGQKPPWTSDQILNDYRFCEVFREDDKVTRWIVKNWLEPYKDHPNLWLACCIARQINWPNTLQAIGFPDGDYEEWASRAIGTMLDLQAAGIKIYTGAYMIYGGPGEKGGFRDKPSWTLKAVIKGVVDHRGELDLYFRETPKKCREFFFIVDWLRKFPGWSGFMADQAACDMSYTHLLDQAKDLMTWCNPGPGCIRGLNRLHDRPLNFKLREKDAVKEMVKLLEIANSSNSPLREYIPRPLKIHTIESALCETDKYLRVLNGEGKPRSLYSPKQEKSS